MTGSEQNGRLKLLRYYEQLAQDFEALPPPCRKELDNYEQSPHFTRTSDWRGWRARRAHIVAAITAAPRKEAA